MSKTLTLMRSNIGKINKFDLIWNVQKQSNNIEDKQNLNLILPRHNSIIVFSIAFKRKCAVNPTSNAMPQFGSKPQ